jgi:hypothetical protein
MYRMKTTPASTQRRHYFRIADTRELSHSGSNRNPEYEHFYGLSVLIATCNFGVYRMSTVARYSTCL